MRKLNESKSVATDQVESADSHANAALEVVSNGLTLPLVPLIQYIHTLSGEQDN